MFEKLPAHPFPLRSSWAWENTPSGRIENYERYWTAPWEKKHNFNWPIERIIFETEIPKEERPMYYGDEKFEWAHLNAQSEDFDLLINPQAIVLPYTSAIVVAEYPFSGKQFFYRIATTKKGFTRLELFDDISRIYKQLFLESEKNPNIRPLHDIDDLDLTGVITYKLEDTDEIYLALEIDSHK